jgi:hypothetical protein
MTRNEILRKIGIIIIELREQYDLTQLNRDDMNDIELELFAANAHFLAEHIEILRKLNNQTAKPLRNPEPKFFEPVVEPTVTEPEETDEDLAYIDEYEEPLIEPPIKVEEPIIAETVIRHELVLDEETEANEEAIDNEEFEPEPEDEPVVEEVVEPITYEEPVAPIPQPVVEEPEEKPMVTINQILSAQFNVSASAGTQHLQPITDLKSAITLNDKLLFVRDLFNGYSMAYSEAIEILNRFSRFEDADQFLKLNYYTKNDWEAKQATTDKFYALLERRFGA